MQSMFQVGIRRMDVFGNPSFGRPYLAQQIPETMPGYTPDPFLQDISKAASIILAPPKPFIPAVVPPAAPAVPASTAVLVGAGLLGAVIAGVVFLT